MIGTGPLQQHASVLVQAIDNVSCCIRNECQQIAEALTLEPIKRSTEEVQYLTGSNS